MRLVEECLRRAAAFGQGQVELVSLIPAVVHLRNLHRLLSYMALTTCNIVVWHVARPKACLPAPRNAHSCCSVRCLTFLTDNHGRLARFVKSELARTIVQRTPFGSDLATQKRPGRMRFVIRLPR